MIEKIWTWIKKYPWAILVSVGGIVGALFLLCSKNNQISSLDDAIQVRAAMRDIIKKEAKAQTLEVIAEEKKEEIKKIEKNIIASKKRVVEIYNEEPLEGKSNSEIARIFTDSGF